MLRPMWYGFAVVLGCANLLAAAEPVLPPGVTTSEFIFAQAPFPQCHASTIAETPRGLVAAWFGGTKEGAADVGIWVSRQSDGQWSTPVEVATGTDAEGKQVPCWNPVLFQVKDGPLLLFSKAGGSPGRWWGVLQTSTDAGQTWTAPQRLPGDILGPIKNKPIALADGSLLCPSSTEHAGWRVHLEQTSDLGKTWQTTGPLNDGKAFSAIQPSILTYADGRMQLLCRSRQGKLVETWSTDGGQTWSAIAATSLPNPNSGTDAVTLKDGRQLLVYNHTPKGRSPLNVAISEDGKLWKMAAVLEDTGGEYSYPAVIQAAAGTVHLTYTWKRQKIKHIALDLSKLQLTDLPN